VIDDGNLEEADISRIESFGHTVLKSPDVDARLKERGLDALLQLARKAEMMKKMLYLLEHFSEEERVLYLDSDVYVRNEVTMPTDTPDILFCRGDVSGYGGSALLPVRHPVVAGLNAGFLLFNPDICSYDFLDNLAERYLMNTGRIWWVEQACWAVVAGHAGHKGIFEGSDACVISGLKKRTPSEIRSNSYKWWGSNENIKDPELVKEMVGEASVIHFAGPGKSWIDLFAQERANGSGEPHTLRWSPIENANFLERAVLAARMGLRR
jgi:hypothetical protein